MALEKLRDITTVISFCLFILTVNGSADVNSENLSSDTLGGFCDSQSEDCSRIEADETDKVLRTEKFVPFKIPSQFRHHTFDIVSKEYANWHNLTLYNSNIKCKDKLSLIFTPNAGLGDSIGALLSAFTYAVRTGRLFFIDWKPYPWWVGFHKLPFVASYDKATKLIDNSGKKLICVDETDPAALLSGHATTEHKIVQLAEASSMIFDSDGLNEYFIQPSLKVQAIIDNVTKLYYHDKYTYKVAIVIRTGEGEYNQFLSKGDELTFVKCFHSYAKGIVKKKPSVKHIFKVLVTSDVEVAKQNAVKELRKINEEENGFMVEVISLEDSNVHVMHLDDNEQKLMKNRARLRKTYAEFFLIGQSDVRFLTHGSLFGRVASDNLPEEFTFFMSDSNCDGKREKYSYLECNTPKYPKFCAHLFK